MKIVTLSELRRMPDGIIAQEYEPENLMGPLFMKICTINFADGPGWTGEILIEPFFHKKELGTDKKTRWTNWCSTDNAYFDHKKINGEEVLFAVYDKNELLTMINILLDGVNTLQPEHEKICESFTNEDMDLWYCENVVLTDNEVDKLLEIEPDKELTKDEIESILKALEEEKE